MNQTEENIINNVKRITKELIIFKNTKQLSWMEVYKEVLKKLNIEKEYNNHTLLIYVVKEISKLGYEINSKPFNLEKK